MKETPEEMAGALVDAMPPKLREVFMEIHLV